MVLNERVTLQVLHGIVLGIAGDESQLMSESDRRDGDISNGESDSFAGIAAVEYYGKTCKVPRNLVGYQAP